MKMMTAIMPANFARIRYSRRMNVLAPSLIRADTSAMVALRTGCFFTQRYR